MRGRPSTKDGSDPFNAAGNPKDTLESPDKYPHVFLHHFHRGDNDDALHNHPWSWSFSFILSGGYIEERRHEIPRVAGPHEKGPYQSAEFFLQCYEVRAEEIQPFTFNYISGDDYHRVDLLDERKGAWTLFVTGPRATSWNFWDRFTGEVTHWRDFINQRRANSGGPMVQEKAE